MDKMPTWADWIIVAGRCFRLLRARHRSQGCLFSRYSLLSSKDHQSLVESGVPKRETMPLWLFAQLATGLSPLAPRSRLERSDFVH
jgi:hypothetical protein